MTIRQRCQLFLASTAEANGCEVYEAKNSIDAGKFVAQKVKENAVILAKGSQNGVFAEEALKPFLSDKSDSRKLVRQDKYWMNKEKRV